MTERCVLGLEPAAWVDGAARLTAGDCRETSLWRHCDLLVVCVSGALVLVVFASSGEPGSGRSLRGSSWGSAGVGALSMVLETPPRPTERLSLLESCVNIQWSIAFIVSAMTKYWLTFDRQLRKPVWYSENSEAAAAVTGGLERDLDVRTGSTSWVK